MKIVITVLIIFILSMSAGYVVMSAVGTNPVKIAPSPTQETTPSEYPTPVPTPSDEVIEYGIFNSVNDYRISLNLKPLKRDPLLDISAKNKLNDMFRYGYWAHNTPDGKEPYVFIQSSGYKYYRVGENLSRDYKSPADIIEAWELSKGHNENLILPSYTDTGIAYKCDRFQNYESCIAVMHYGTPQKVLGAQTITKVAPTTQSVVQTASPTTQTTTQVLKPSRVPVPLSGGGFAKCDPEYIQVVSNADRTFQESRSAYNACLEKDKSDHTVCLGWCTGVNPENCRKTCMDSFDLTLKYCETVSTNSLSDYTRTIKAHCDYLW